MKPIKPHLVAKADEKDRWTHIIGESIPVQFEDGIVNLTAADIIHSSYAWEILVEYNLPIYKHNVSSMYTTDGQDTPATNNKLLESVLRVIMEPVMDSVSSDYTYGVMKHITVANNRIFNAMTCNLGEYVLGTDVYDHIAIANHPDILAVYNKAYESGFTMAACDVAFKEAGDLIKKGLMVNGNISPLSFEVRSSITKVQQLLQIVLFRTYVPDCDSVVINKPISTSLLEGLYTYSDYSILTREGLVSLAASINDIATVSYNSRKLKLVVTYFNHIYQEDCKTTNHRLVRIRDDIVEDGIILEHSNIHAYMGKCYLTDDNRTIKITRANMEGLKGKTLKIRSVLTCAHGDRQGCCSVCMGDIHLSMPNIESIGMVISPALSGQMIQAILSIKHDLLLMTKGPTASLTGKYLTKISGTNTMFKLSSKFASLVNRKTHETKLFIHINKNEFQGIHDISTIDDPRSLSRASVSSIGSVGFQSIFGDESKTEALIINTESKAVLTYEFIQYVKDNYDKVSVIENSFIIDITEYGKILPIIYLPETRGSSVSDSNRIQSMMETRDRSKLETVEDVLGDLERSINGTGINQTNISLLETSVYSYLAEKNNERLTRLSPATRHLSGDEVLTGRSLSSMLSHKYHLRILTAPASYLKTKRENTPVDIQITPGGVVSAYKRKMNKK